jgi:hypothetical protein
MKSIITALFLVFVVAVSGCPGLPTPPSNNSSPTGNAVLSSLNISNAANEIAKLPTLDNNSVSQFDSYKTFADNVNDIIKILKDKTKFDSIPTLGDTQADYDKVSKVVTEWAPLVGNYNRLVNSARKFNESDQSSVQEFYTSSAIFGAEASIIYAAAFYKPAYETVGIIYRGSGLQSLAFDCGPCVSVVLSQSHWLIRTAMVEASSKAVEYAINSFEALQNNSTTIQDFERNVGSFINNIGK